MLLTANTRPPKGIRPSPKTVNSVIKKFAKHCKNLPGRRGKRKTDERTLRRLVRMMEKTPRLTSKDLKDNLEQSGVMVSTSTTHRTLNQAGLHGQRSKKTPLLKKRHTKGTTDFCQRVPEQTTIFLGKCSVDR